MLEDRLMNGVWAMFPEPDSVLCRCVSYKIIIIFAEYMCWIYLVYVSLVVFSNAMDTCRDSSLFESGQQKLRKHGWRNGISACKAIRQELKLCFADFMFLRIVQMRIQDLLS